MEQLVVTSRKHTHFSMIPDKAFVPGVGESIRCRVAGVEWKYGHFNRECEEECPEDRDCSLQKDSVNRAPGISKLCGAGVFIRARSMPPTSTGQFE